MVIELVTIDPQETSPADYFIESIEMIFQTVYYEENDRGDAIMQEVHSDIFILGAGAGGFGACYQFTKCGYSVAIADQNPGYGGTAVYGGICCWEPGVSFPGVHEILAQRLLSAGKAQVQKTVPSGWIVGSNSDEWVSERFPWGLSMEAKEDYAQTLKRCRQFCNSPKDFRRFMTDGASLGQEMANLIHENTGKCREFFNCKYAGCELKENLVHSVTLSNGTDLFKVYAKHFLDCSGSIVLARDAGCKYACGDDSGNLSGINGVSLVFRVSKRGEEQPVQLKHFPDPTDWAENRLARVVSCFNLYPNGDINVNMLPTMTGEEMMQFGDNAWKIGCSRVKQYWERMQKEHGLAEYEIVEVFRLGIREDYRLIGRHVLDIEEILLGNTDGDEIIAIADHPMDLHGVKGFKIGELEKPYGIPFDCCRTNEYDNLFVVCRGASFTHAAAASARLSRTMISLGEGVAKRIINMF